MELYLENQSSSLKSEGSQSIEENSDSKSIEQSPEEIEELAGDSNEESKEGHTGKTFPCTFAGCNKILGRQSRLKSHI